MSRPRSSFAAFSLALLGLVAACGSNDGGPNTPASSDPKELVLIRVEPADGESSVARNVKVRLTFSTQVLPQSVHDLSLQVRTGGTFQTRPDGQFLVSGSIVEFDPTVLASGGENALGFPSGSQILVKIPLFEQEQPEPHNLFLQNIEGNPIRTTSQDNEITFITGFGWNDPVEGSPGVLGLEFVPES